MALFAGIVGAAFLVNQTQGASFDKPKTHNPETHKLEREIYLFQGDIERDPVLFNYSKNSHRQLPKFDYRDGMYTMGRGTSNNSSLYVLTTFFVIEPEENKYYIACHPEAQQE